MEDFMVGNVSFSPFLHYYSLKKMMIISHTLHLLFQPPLHFCNTTFTLELTLVHIHSGGISLTIIGVDHYWFIGRNNIIKLYECVSYIEFS